MVSIRLALKGVILIVCMLVALLFAASWTIDHHPLFVIMSLLAIVYIIKLKRK